MKPYLFRASSIGKLMTEPKTQKEGLLSVGARTYIRELAQQEIFGVDFEFSSKETTKGIEMEGESIALLNRVRGLNLTKNTERRSNEFVTGECDLYDEAGRRGRDIKTSWSTKTFPGWVVDAEDKLYEWQVRTYMWLWDAREWEVNFVLIDTPDKLIGYEPLSMHVVGHIPEHMRLTSWIVQRDAEKEDAIRAKVAAARDYFAQVVLEFDHYHRPALLAA